MPSQAQLKAGANRARRSLRRAKPGSISFKVDGVETPFDVGLDQGTREQIDGEGGAKSVKGITFLLGRDEHAAAPKIGLLVTDLSDSEIYEVISVVPAPDHYLVRAGQFKK